MKIEILPQKPDTMHEDWPGEFASFSALEPRLGIPDLLMLITTRKANGNANACLHAGVLIAGGPESLYAVLTGLGPGGHTYPNIVRDGGFCINFMPPELYDACQATIAHNEADIDELAAAGLHAEPAVTVPAPRIAEAFLTLECRLTGDVPLAGDTTLRLLTAQVVHAAADPGHRGPAGFTTYSNDAQNRLTGEERQHYLSTLHWMRKA